jgi:hypothetical protein
MNQFKDTSQYFKYVILYFAIAFMFIVRLIYLPEDFADFNSYIIYTDALFHYRQNFSYTYEPSSSIIFLLSRSIFGDTYLSVSIIHELSTLIFCFGFYSICRNRIFEWQGVLLVFCIYGSLLAFVTIRATPAYLLIITFVLNLEKNHLYRIWLILFAFSFHISVMLTFIPLLVLVLQKNNTYVKLLFSSNRFLFTSMLIIFTVIILIYGLIGEFLYSTVANIPIISKYLTYLVYFDQTLQDSVSETATDRTFHYIYGAAITLFLVAFLRQNSEKCVSLRGYIVTSYVIFVFLYFSPVVAFRQSIYWCIPMLIAFPWNKQKIPGVFSVGVLFFGLALFTFTFGSVFES